MGSDPEKDKRLWGMLCHLTALVIFLGIPLGNVFGPLVVWLIKKNENPFIDEHGKESLNFQISMTIYLIISVVLAFVLIGFLFIFIIALIDLIFVIIASVKANEGQTYRYPLTIRFF